MLAFELAYILGMKVYDLYSTMTYEEFTGWQAYFERRPYQWRDDERAFKFLQTQGIKESPGTIFKSLQPIYNPPVDTKEGEVSVLEIKNSSIFAMLSKAVGGDKVEL
jgi:hypothetical protein